MEKLKVEQRKLWRKTFHQERDQGVAPAVAAQKADEAVKEWDERGAFDEEWLPCVRPFWLPDNDDRHRFVSWVLPTVGPGDAAIFAGDTLKDEHGQRWEVADTATYRGSDLVRVFHACADSSINLPNFGSAMTFDSPRFGCASVAVYVGGESVRRTKL